MARLDFEIVHRETDHVAVNGRPFRSPTVLIRVNRSVMSRNVFVLGALLIACHIADGYLTFVGISNFGVMREANPYIGRLVAEHGVIPGIFLVKTAGIAITLLMMWLSNSRRWLRPFIVAAIAMYLALAVIPWIVALWGEG